MFKPAVFSLQHFIIEWKLILMPTLNKYINPDKAFKMGELRPYTVLSTPITSKLQVQQNPASKHIPLLILCEVTLRQQQKLYYQHSYKSHDNSILWIFNTMWSHMNPYSVWYYQQNRGPSSPSSSTSSRLVGTAPLCPNRRRRPRATRLACVIKRGYPQKSIATWGV